MSKARLLIALVITLGLGSFAAWMGAASAAAEDNPAQPAFPEAHPAQTTLAAAAPYTTFVELVAGEPNTFDPALDYETEGILILSQIYEPLVFFNREDASDFIPLLATDWNTSPDGLVYTFHIRPGVRFHNGNLLTPQDVAYTFQRGILQGGSQSPQWMLTEPFFGPGMNDITHLINPNLEDDRAALQQVSPAVLQQTCQQVKAAIVADNVQGTVTMTLAQPWGPFLTTLAQSWGGIMDQEWVVEHGGWDGSCTTWQNYYAMSPDEDPFTSITNGTGPFYLDFWTPSDEVSLRRNNSYWRTQPIWDGGPTGPASFERVRFLRVDDESTRYAMLSSGEADMAQSTSSYFGEMDNLVLYDFTQNSGLSGNLIHPDGVLNRYSGGLANSANDAFLNFNIETGGPRNYIGSGVLDGSGIPPDFFSDLHVRKAFNYAFDWSTYISDMYGGHAIQRRGPIVAGLPGYNDTQPTYFYSPTLALQEFSLAWGGAVIDHGFTMTLTYNTWNPVRQAVASILKTNIEALDPRFHINVVELSSGEYFSDQNNRLMPVIIRGWLQDYPHPHNWVVPYMVGIFALSQNLPAEMISAYQDQINTCVTQVGSAAQACYEGIQNSTYQDALDIFLAQAQARQYIRAEVRGHYINPALTGPYIYALSKGPMPTIQTVTPGINATVSFSSTSGASASMELPAGSVTQTVDIIVTPDTIANGEPAGFRLGNLSFDINAYVGGTPLPGLTFDEPVILTIHYNLHATRSISEDSLRLFWWNGSAWVDAACGAIQQDLVNDTLQVPVCHFSKFALGGTSHQIALPVVQR